MKEFLKFSSTYLKVLACILGGLSIFGFVLIYGVFPLFNLYGDLIHKTLQIKSGTLLDFVACIGVPFSMFLSLSVTPAVLEYKEKKAEQKPIAQS